MFRNSVIHEILSDFLQPFRYVGTRRVFPYLLVILVLFGFGVLIGLGNNASPRSLQHVNLTQALVGNLSHSDFSLSRVSLSLNTVVVGEVDELEEEVR